MWKYLYQQNHDCHEYLEHYHSKRFFPFYLVQIYFCVESALEFEEKSRSERERGRENAEKIYLTRNHFYVHFFSTKTDTSNALSSSLSLSLDSIGICLPHSNILARIFIHSFVSNKPITVHFDRQCEQSFIITTTEEATTSRTIYWNIFAYDRLLCHSR